MGIFFFSFLVISCSNLKKKSIKLYEKLHVEINGKDQLDLNAIVSIILIDLTGHFLKFESCSVLKDIFITTNPK